MNFLFEHIGALAGILSLCAWITYFISILSRKTRPSRSTWWILTFVGGLILWSSYVLGAYENLWIQTAYVLGPLIIALLSIFYGENQGLSQLDKICFFGAIFSGLLWIIFNSPLIGFIGSIIVDFIGLTPTIRKSFIKPEEEDPKAWMIETVASLLNIFAITTWFTLEHRDWIYALYLLTINGLITALLWRKGIKLIF